MNINLDKYPNLNPLTRFTDKLTGKRFYNSPNGPLPSVTTILSSTQPKEKRESLENWRKAIGENKAAAITKLSTDVGTLAHTHIQALAIGEPGVTGNHPLRQQARDIGESHYYNQWLPNVTEIFGIETDLYYEGLYAGACDAIVTYQGELAIYDIKTSRKTRSEEHIADYLLQISAYCLAFESLTGVEVNHGVIALTTHQCTNQTWLMDGDLMKESKRKWIDRVEQYYSM